MRALLDLALRASPALHDAATLLGADDADCLEGLEPEENTWVSGSTARNGPCSL